MARAKSKAAAIQVPVPQNDGEAEQLLARLGVSQRDQVEAQTRHDASVAALEKGHGQALKDFQSVQAGMIEGLSVWATANRERLTNKGRTKKVQLPTGTIAWREGRYAVKHRGLRNEDLVQKIRDRIEAVNAEIVKAKVEEARAMVRALQATKATLVGFLRIKVEPNKEAMLAGREVAETVDGVTVPRGPEEFTVEPLGSQLREVA